MAKAKRVFELAKELGVKSKAIVEKCDAEGVPGITNHMSTVKIGLAVTIRQWFGEEASDAGTAIETAEKVDLKRSASRVRRPPPSRMRRKVAMQMHRPQPRPSRLRPKRRSKRPRPPKSLRRPRQSRPRKRRRRRRLSLPPHPKSRPLLWKKHPPLRWRHRHSQRHLRLLIPQVIRLPRSRLRRRRSRSRSARWASPMSRPGPTSSSLLVRCWLSRNRFSLKAPRFCVSKNPSLSARRVLADRLVGRVAAAAAVVATNRTTVSLGSLAPVARPEARVLAAAVVGQVDPHARTNDAA